MAPGPERPACGGCVAPPAGWLPALVGRRHERRVLRVLREHGALSRRQLAAYAGLSRTTLSGIAGELLSRGAIMVVDTDAERRSGGGRPAQMLALDPSTGQYLGVDLGPARVRVAVVGASHDVLATGHAGYPAGCGWPERLGVAFDLIERIAAEHDLSFTGVQGVAVGMAGPHPGAPVDRPGAPVDADAAGPAGAVPELIRAGFTARLRPPRLLVDSDARLGALAEALAGAPDARDLLYLRLSDAVGGGLVIGGRLVTGDRGAAGRFGHVTVDPLGATCRCGRRGCLETVASVPAVLRACARRGLVVRDPAELAAATGRRDPVAVAVLSGVGTAVGRVLATAALVLAPERIVLGGALTGALDPVIASARKVIAAELRAGAGTAPPLLPARLGDDDGVLGAVAALLPRTSALVGYPAAAPGPADPSRPAAPGRSTHPSTPKRTQQ